MNLSHRERTQADEARQSLCFAWWSGREKSSSLPAATRRRLPFSPPINHPDFSSVRLSYEIVQLGSFAATIQEVSRRRETFFIRGNTAHIRRLIHG